MLQAAVQPDFTVYLVAVQLTDVAELVALQYDSLSGAVAHSLVHCSRHHANSTERSTHLIVN